MKDIDFISAVSILLPLIAGLFRFKLSGNDFRWLFIFFLISAITEFIAHSLKRNGVNNLWLGNIFFLLEYVFWSFIIAQWLHSKKIRLFIFIFLPAYFIIWCVTTFMVLDFYMFNSYARTIESLVFVFLSCFLLIAVSTDTTQLIFKNPKFWFGSALLIYFSVNLIVFGTANYISSNQEQLMNNTWIIHSFTNIFANLLFAIGFLCIRQKAI